MEEHTRKSSSDTSPAECNWKNGKEKRRTSILKPPKLRTPLKELQFTSTQEVKDDTTARQSRRVSFGHFHVRKFGYENGVVCDSIYSFESSKSEASSQANNSVGENNEVPATNSSDYCKNTSPKSANYKKDSHVKENLCQNASKNNCAEVDNKSNETDIGICSLKNSPGYSAVDTVPRRHSSDAVRTDYKDIYYYQKEKSVGLNSVVSNKMQSVHKQDDIKQLFGLAKCGREQCEQKNEAEAHNSEHHLNSATVTDMELADSYSYGHIDCKEESLLGIKNKKSVDTTEKSFYFRAESDMELTKVIDTSCCGEVLNKEKDKSISLNKTRAKTNLLSSCDGHISSDVKDCYSMKNGSQLLNSTKRFSTNNGMDITEGCGIIDSSSHSDIPNDGMDDEVNSHILSISRLSVDEEGGDINEGKTSKYSTHWNPVELFEKSFINESMEQTVGVGCVLSENDTDYRDVIKDFRRSEDVSCHLEYCNDDPLPINGEKCSSVTAATRLNENTLTDHLKKCSETKPDEINNFNTSKTILMCVDMESTQITSDNGQDNSFMQFTKVVEGNIQDSSIKDSLGNKHISHTEYFNIGNENESVMAKSPLKHDMDLTQVKSPLCDSRSVPEVVAIERQTDISVTATSREVSSFKDQQNDSKSSCILDTRTIHPQVLKSYGNEEDSTVSKVSGKTNHSGSCKERVYEMTTNDSFKQTEYKQDRSVKYNSPLQTLEENSKICTISSSSPKFKSEIIQGKQTNNMGNSMCGVQSNSSVIREFCVAPISATENISNNRNSASKILPKFSECQSYSGNRTELHRLPTQAVEDYLVTDNKTQRALGTGMAGKKRRSSEKEETREGTKSRKKQYISTDHISDKELLQSTTELCGLVVETKAVYDRDATAALHVNSDVMTTAMSERTAPKIVDMPSDINSLQGNNSMALLETGRTNVSLPHPSDPNSKLNLSYSAKTMVFNNPSGCGLDLTCETSSVAIEMADYKNKLSGSILVTDKRNSNSPLPENEVLKRNTNDGDVIDISKNYGQKIYPRHSEEASSTTGTPVNISEVNFTHTLLTEHKNAQHTDDSGVFQRNSAEGIHDDINNLFSANESNDNSTVTFRRRRRYESNVSSLSLVQKYIKIGDYCTETDNKHKSEDANNAELSRDVGKTAAFSQNDENLTSVKKGDDQTVEGMEVLISSRSESSFCKAGAAIHIADKTFHSWYCEKRASVGSDDNASSADKIDLNDSCQNTSGATKSVIDQAADVTNEAVRVDNLPSKNEEIVQNVTQNNNILDFKTSKGYLSPGILLAEAKEKIPDVHIDSTSNYLMKNREQDSFSEYCVKISSDTGCLQQCVPENGNSSSCGKKINYQQFHYNDPLKSPDLCVEVMTVIPETKNSQENKEKCHSLSNLMEASQPVEVNQPQETGDPLVPGEPLEASRPLKVNQLFEANMPLEASELEASRPLEVNHPFEASVRLEDSELPEASQPLNVSESLEVNKLLQVHESLQNSEPPEVNILCEADPSCSNTQRRITTKISQDSCLITNTAQDCISMVLDKKLQTSSVDKGQDLPPRGLNASGYVSPVSPLAKYVRQCSRDLSSKAESPKIGMIIDGVQDMGGSPIICGGQQNSVCGSFNNEVAVHSEALYTTPMKMNNMAVKEEITKVMIEEEKPVEDKWKKLENTIISQAKRSEVLWNISAMTQFQWIFTFLNGTLRLYIHFDKPAEVSTIQDVNLISHLTGKADEDAKFVHFVLLKKFSKNRLKALCKDIEEVPKLLENISVDVHRMLTFLYEFEKVQLLYNMEMFGASVSFNISSHKLAICFKLNIDLSNWEQILEDSITISQKYGHVNEAEIKNLANGVERNSHFLRNYFKAVQQYMKILERFGC